MSTLVYRDAAHVLVRSRPDEVGQLISKPGVLASLGLGSRATGAKGEEGPVVRALGPDEFQATTPRGDRTLRIKMEPAEEGTRIWVSSTVQPDNPVDSVVHMFFPQRAHEDLQERLERFRALAEALSEDG